MGTLLITNVETREPVNVLEQEFLRQMYPFRWGRLVLGPGDQTCTRIALRKCALLLDTRIGGKIVNCSYQVS